MKKTYIRPALLPAEATMQEELMVKTSGLPILPPDDGGDDDGSHEVAVKPFHFSVWEDDDDE